MLYEKWFLGEMQEQCSVEEEVHYIHQACTLLLFREICTSLLRKQNHDLLPRLVCVCYDYVNFKVSWIWLLIWLMLRNTARAARQQTAYSMVTSLWVWALEKCDECTRKEGVISTFTWLMFIMQKTISLLYGRHFPPSFPHISLAPRPTFPFLWNACHTG